VCLSSFQSIFLHTQEMKLCMQYSMTGYYAIFLFIICLLGCCLSYQLTPDEFVEILSSPATSNEKYLIIFLERLGLANRFRTLADWYLISLVSERTLIVSWKPTVECNISFSDLFDGVPPKIKFLSEPISSTEIPTLQNYLSSHQKSHQYYTGDEENFWVSKNLGYLVLKNYFLNEISYLFTSYDGQITLEDIPCQYYSQKHSFFLNSLQPKKEYLDLVENIWENYFKDFIPVGIHLRLNDPRYDWAVVPPFGGSGPDANQAKEFGVGATLEHFYSAMKTIEKYFEWTVPVPVNDDNPSDADKTKTVSLVRFFVASNNKIEKQKLLEYFPTAVSLTLSSEVLSPRDSLEGMEHAFLEWLLLSKTSLIINTYGSSFAVEAAYRSSIPIAGVYEGYLVAHDSPFLQHCGIMQFAKYLQKTAEPMSFKEGTVDNREVRNLNFVLFCFCS
jgi:hypothetical protein